jgi:hypothetical protein
MISGQALRSSAPILYVMRSQLRDVMFYFSGGNNIAIDEEAAYSRLQHALSPEQNVELIGVDVATAKGTFTKFLAGFSSGKNGIKIILGQPVTVDGNTANHWPLSFLPHNGFDQASHGNDAAIVEKPTEKEFFPGQLSLPVIFAQSP